MIHTPTTKLALSVSAVAHQDQSRKVSSLPYIIHPVSVTMILSEYTDNDKVLAAGLLHDVLEDQPEVFSEAKLEEWFGKDVLDTVRVVTKDSSIKSWRKRNEKYIQTLLDSRDGWAYMVCAADKIVNLTDMLNDYDEYGEELWKSFNAGAEDQYWWYSSVLELLQKVMPDHELTSRLRALVDRFGRLLYDKDKRNIKQLLLGVSA